MDAGDVMIDFGKPVEMETSSAPVSQQQQQQTAVLLVNSQNCQAPPLIQSFSGHIVLACCTFWCCGGALGLAAFILAVMAQNLSTSPSSSDRMTARHLGTASFWISIAGVIIGSIVIIVSVAVAVANANRAH